jgi:hypothetical protein
MMFKEMEDQLRMPYNEVIKERIHAAGGKLIYSHVTDYTVKATDVRLLKIKKGSADFQFVYREGARVSHLVKEKGADFGFNGPFFWDGHVLGDSEDHDLVISAAYGKMLKWWEFAAVDGEVFIGQIDKNDRQDFLVQGAPPLIDNGNLCYDYFRILHEVPDDIGKSSAQRTFVGKTAEGDLLLAIADGRTWSDKGLTLEEMALYMQDKGAINALNLDGGSSTILANQDGGMNQWENTYTNERTVHHALLIFLKPEPVVDWKQEGADWLLANGYLTQAHDKNEPVDIGLLGAMMKNKAENGL